MFRKLTIASMIVLVLSLAFASVSFAQTGTGNQSNQQDQAQGTNPGAAFSSLAQSGRNLGAGQQHWYAFQYAGDNSQITVRLRNASNMQFSIWSEQDIQNASGNFGANASPVGRSTANDAFGGEQYWTGSFNAPGTYYIMVEPANGGNGGNYALDVSGTGVSWRGQSQAATANNQQAQNAQGATTSSNNASTNNSATASGATAQGGVAPSTLPQTGGEMASVLPMLIGGMGALSVAAGVLLRREK